MSRFYGASPVTFPTAPASRLRYCFHTTEDGRIPIVTDWPQVLESLAAMPSVCIQIRHAYARMSARVRASEPCLPLDLSPLKWKADAGGHAWAKLEVCSCCDSPGRLCVFNTAGQEYLQFCPPASIQAQGWAGVLAPLALLPEDEPAPVEAAGPDHPVLSDAAGMVSLHCNGLIQLLLAYADLEEPLALAMRTAEASLIRSLVPDSVEFDDFQLTVRGDDCGFVLGLGGVRAFAIEERQGDEWLLAVGPGATVLAEVGPAEGVRSRIIWQTLLHKALHDHAV
ncbi:MAG: hypothetical protein Q7P63_07615 [Verrucomicrobiota bacterium JB022]|nr:hypothetical protein [Verrucomicrobiota bacterium JB022]